MLMSLLGLFATLISAPSISNPVLEYMFVIPCPDGDVSGAMRAVGVDTDVGIIAALEVRVKRFGGAFEADGEL